MMLATTRLLGDGARTAFTFRFAGGYLDAADVVVKLDGSELPPSAYSVSGQTVELGSPPDRGVVVEVARRSWGSKATVAWGAGVGAEATAEDITAAYRQMLFLTQELSDHIGRIETLGPGGHGGATGGT